MATNLKIGVDFHGVITANPDGFREFINGALKRGHEVHIISGGKEEDIRQYLTKHGILCTKIFAMFDYYDKMGEVSVSLDGRFYVKDELWNRGKAEYCNREHIDIHIDDSVHFAQGINSVFCYYDKATQTCYLNDVMVLDFGESTEESIDKVEFLCS